MPTAATITLLTRGSPLARKQAELSAQTLRSHFPATVTTRVLTTTGDRQQSWSLEKTGGTGLFTTELEDALLAHTGDIAVHSAKDLPAALRPGLALAGYLPRANPADILIRRADRPVPAVIATGSPRRRAQALLQFPDARFIELRGNVDTRLRKIADGAADATFLAAAGLSRLGIASWPGLVFEEWGLDKMVPAAGQAAIAWEVRAADLPRFAPYCDSATATAVNIERLFLSHLGAGCHTAFAVHYRSGELHLFHEALGHRVFPFFPDAPHLPQLADILRPLGV
jgi:hydroxymethylbilane synthase